MNSKLTDRSKVLLFALGWALCGFMNWGLILGQFTHQFPYMKHTGIAGFVAITGPLGLPASFLCSSHWRITPLSVEERWKAFNRDWRKVLTRDYFERMYN